MHIKTNKYVIIKKEEKNSVVSITLKINQVTLNDSGAYQFTVSNGIRRTVNLSLIVKGNIFI